MSRKVRIVAFAGSTRKDSSNKKIVRIAAQAAEAAGAEVTLIDLKEYPMPLYDGDVEAAEGVPQHGRRLKQALVDSDGFLLAAPEYNSSISGVLKNAIDWVSRPVKGEPPLVAFQGKVAALMSASPGGLGGLRGLVHVRAILGNIGVIVLPEQVAIAKVHEALDGNGRLKDAAQQASIEQLGQGLVAVLTKLRA